MNSAHEIEIEHGFLQTEMSGTGIHSIKAHHNLIQNHTIEVLQQTTTCSSVNNGGTNENIR